MQKNTPQEKLYAEVIVDISSSSVDKVFDYSLPFFVEPGTRVMVPFGNRKIEGYIIKVKNQTAFEESKIKSILYQVDDFSLIGQEMLELMNFMKWQYNLKYIDILKLFLPSELRSGKVRPLTQTMIFLNPNINLDEKVAKFRKNAKNMFGIVEFLKENGAVLKTILNQEFSSQSVNKLLEDEVIVGEQIEKLRKPYVEKKFFDSNFAWTGEQKRAIDEITKFENKTYVLHGVTGSGKTEVYLQAISEVLKQGKTAILLVPEISLTPQMFAQLRARFEEDVAILHSGLSQGERFDEWNSISQGKARVVVGARSAIFAPIKNLGIIIVDEEHDSSYTSESNPRFSTHEVASFKAQYNACPLVLGSATPSVETFYKTTTGEYHLLSMPQRVNKRALPQIKIVDMLGQLKFGNTGIFSSYMVEELSRVVKEKKQAMLFLNRRGFSSFMMCRECGYVAKCSDCDVSLVYHKNDSTLKCHYCNKKYKALTHCKDCNSTSIKQGAIGTEKVVEEVKKLFPNLKVLRMDNDTTKKKNSHQEILQEFSSSYPSVLVGTQMIAKGHDFKDVIFVGIVDADQSLYQSDYKSTERTFSLITQMSGRAGREKLEGNVVLQTYAPKHYAYRFAANYDFDGFFEKEISLRKATHFPPFSQIIRLLFSSENDTLVKQSLKNVFLEVDMLKKQYEGSFYYINATQSPISRIQRKHRYQILMRFNAQQKNEITQKIYDIVNKNQTVGVSLFVEVNPQSLS